MQADFVSIDNAGAVLLGARHLVEAGYRELLFVSEPIKNVSSRMEREAAFSSFIGDAAADSAGLHGSTFECTDDDSAGLDKALREPAPARRRHVCPP